MISIIWGIFAFVIAISILIAFHEFGHFSAARLLGVKVLRFSIGFGKPLLSFKDRSGTEYALAAIPFGGYVKMLDENEGDVAPSELDKTFNRKPAWKKIVIVVAGPCFNIIFAVLAYWLMFSIGVTTLPPIIGNVDPGSIAQNAGLKSGNEIVFIDKHPTRSWRDVSVRLLSHIGNKGRLSITIKDPKSGLEKDHYLDLTKWHVNPRNLKILKSIGVGPYYPPIPPIIGSVFLESPASGAGIKKGDKIISIDGHAVAKWKDLSKLINERGGKETTIRILRDGKVSVVQLKPDVLKSENGKSFARIGVESVTVELPPELFYKEKYPIFGAGIAAVNKTFSMIGLTFGMLLKMITGKLSVKAISGPIGIARGAGISASLGLTRYLDFLGLISVSLGALNILPIPVLDGGFLMFYLIELVRRKPVSIRLQEMCMKIGIILLVGLMSLAVYNDIGRLFS